MYKEEWCTKHHLTNTKYSTIETLVAAHIQEKFERVVSDVAAAVDKLLSDEKLRARLGEHGRKMVTKGEFSIKYKNEKLKKIFEKAVD